MLPPRAYVFIVLNVVRALSIIALLLVFSSNISVMVTDIRAVNANANANATSLITCDYIAGSTVPDQPAGVFWAVVNRLLIIVQALILICSELGWPAIFFDRYFPVLGSSFGLGALGIFQCLIGATVLSQHTDSFTLVSAFFLFSLGCLNILLGLIFREKAKTKRSILSWREEAKGLLPSVPSIPSTPDLKARAAAFTPSPPPSFVSAGTWTTGNSTEGYGFGRQGEKAAGLKGFILSKPLETLPRYAAKPTVSRSPPSTARASAPVFMSSETAV